MILPSVPVVTDVGMNMEEPILSLPEGADVGPGPVIGDVTPEPAADEDGETTAGSVVLPVPSED